MKIGGLSEQEVKKIGALLDSEKVPHEIKVDEEMLQRNEQSLNSLDRARFRTGRGISLHVLSIEFEDESFSKMSDVLKERLLDFGITDMVPDESDFLETKEARPTKTGLPAFIVKAGLMILVFGYIYILLSRRL